VSNDVPQKAATPAELERAGRAALGKPVTVTAKHSRVEPPKRVEEEKKTVSGPRSFTQIESEIDQARNNLAGTLDEIVFRVKPANVAKRVQDKARAQVIDPDTGQPRMERIIPAAAGVVGLVVLVTLLKRRKK
jgi:hypothetical protein